MYNLNKFDDNGVCWPLKLYNQYNSGELEKEFDKFKKLSIKNFGSVKSLKPHLLSTFFDDLANDKNIIAAVKQVIGENIYIWSSAFFAKAQGEGKIVSYHQDNPYWQLTTDKVVTAWVALTKSQKISGALEVVPGSHKLGIIKKLDVENARKSYLNGEKTTSENDLLSYNQNLKDYIKKNKPLALEMMPGEFSLHHVNTVHGSGINKSNHPRIGFAIRYISSETQHFEEKSDSALHVCGKKNPYYKDEMPPTKDFSMDSLNQYKLAMKSTGVFGNKKY